MSNKSNFPDNLYVVLEETNVVGSRLIARPTPDAFSPEDTIGVYELKSVLPRVPEKYLKPKGD